MLLTTIKLDLAGASVIDKLDSMALFSFGKYVFIVVNIYLEFYGLAECSISRKFYETHLEVFKSLH